MSASARPVRRQRQEGFPENGPAPELIESGFALENADAAFLHHGLNLADLAHVLDLARRGIIPADARRALLAALLDVVEIAPEDFPYDPAYGEPYNSRERYLVSRLGDVAGWLHAGPARAAGRPRPADGRHRLGHRRPGRGARGDAAAGPDLPATGAAVDVRALPPLLRLPRGARRPPPARRAGRHRHQPGRRRLRERHPAARRP
jgi:hypothetical protein